MSDRVAYVRALFDVFAAEGIDGILRLTPPDVVWAPLAAEGREFVGDEVREHFAARRAAVTDQHQTVHVVDEVAPGVVFVTGTMQLRSRGSQIDLQPTWVFEFDGDLLRRATGHPTRAAARAWVETRRGSVAP